MLKAGAQSPEMEPRRARSRRWSCRPRL